MRCNPNSSVRNVSVAVVLDNEIVNHQYSKLEFEGFLPANISKDAWMYEPIWEYYSRERS